MPHAFSLDQDRCAALSDPTLREEIQRHTENAAATDQILRSISRFGFDPSILRFDMSPAVVGRGTRFDAPASWAVRAVREGQTAEPSEGDVGDPAGT